jgi:hypothetical protein
VSRLLALVAVCAGGAGCATAAIALPAGQAAQLERELAGEQRFLRVSMYSTPFFKDASKRLLTPVAPELVQLLDNPDGTPITPGPVEGTWPAGARARIVKVEYPTSWVMAERVLYTPRALAWVYVELADAPRGAAPFVIVLRPGIKQADEFRAELDRLLTRDDPAGRLSAFTEAVRDGVRTKTAAVDMPAEALEMTWGPPDARRIELDGTRKRETWSWAQGKRVAVLVDGVTSELYPTGKPRAP